MPITQERMKLLIDASADFQKHARVLEELGETLQERLRQELISPLEAFNDLRLASIRRYALDDFAHSTHVIEMEEQAYRLTSGRNRATKKWKERRRRAEGIPERPLPAGPAGQKKSSFDGDFPALPEELTPEQQKAIAELMKKGRGQGE